MKSDSVRFEVPMRQYHQIAKLIEQNFSHEEIVKLTNEPLHNVELIAANYEFENKMQANGFDRYMERQAALKDHGKTLETDPVMHKLKAMLKPVAESLIRFVVTHESRKPHIAVKVLSKVNVYQAALIAMRLSILAITNDKTELAALLINIGEQLQVLYGAELNKSERIRVGYKVVSLMCANSDSCFTLVRKRTNLNLVYHIEATEAFEEWESNHLQEMAELAIMYRPMVVKPRPWTSLKHGGYYADNLQQGFIRNKSRLTERTHGVRRIPKVYEAVNKIQATRFTVNRFVLDVANELVSDVNCCFKKFYQEIPASPYDEKVSTLKARKEALEKQLGITEESRKAHKENFGEWVRELLGSIKEGHQHTLKIELEETRYKLVQMYKWHKEKTSRTSKNRVITTALEVANDYRDYEAIYIPHNIDWRGRVYPMCSGLTTQGVTLQKALLKFAEGKPIGSIKALNWLAVHVANTYGEDKKSWQDRIKWTMEHEDLIKRVAKDPMGNLEDWRDTDEPWLFLAACEQMNKFYHDGLDAVVDIAIPMDGTCNGAQHYSAMTRDSKGAYGVNVAPNGTQNLRDRLAVIREQSRIHQAPLGTLGAIDSKVNSEMQRVIEGK